MWFFMLSAAHAGAIPAWSVEEFGDGTWPVEEGWTAGYTDDSWFTYLDYLLDRGDVSLSEEGYEADGSDWPGFGNATSADNWLVRGEALSQQVVVLEHFNQDDDTFGLVVNVSSADSFMVIAHTADTAPPPVFGVDEPTLYVVRVEGGVGELITAVGADLDEDENMMIATLNNGTIRVVLNGELLIDGAVYEPLPVGQTGFYSYNNGYENDNITGDCDEGGCNGVVEGLQVSWLDEDDDLVADDDDNCEELANEDQADADGDGLGDLCDDDPYGEQEGEDTGSTGDSGGGDSGGGDSGVDGVDPDEVVLVNTGCACGTSPGGTGSAWWWVALGALGLWRRNDVLGAPRSR